MKKSNGFGQTVILLATAAGLLASRAVAQNITWGSEIFSDLRDSRGEVLDQNSYVFQLGTFQTGFTPTSMNTADWASNWVVFDQASYNEGFGYITSATTMNADGSSSYDPGSGFNFSGLTVYLWVYNGTTMSSGTEWFLGSAAAWGSFPAAESECCGNSLPVELSLSDLSGGDTPIWGSQGGVDGNGYSSVGGNFTLQTFSVIPEPSLCGLAICGGMVWILRRKRN
ncbi:MAG: hypothetical protein MUF31_05175 [Akkermansiaceae bacterium]|jgi:hypothetical protein|nr:hypothetical protein [Akkermansiaceae bacterium]